MTNQNMSVSSKTSEDLPPRPDGADYEDKQCVDCGVTVEPQYWPGFIPKGAKKDINGRWLKTSERCPECEKKDNDKMRKKEAERQRLENIDRFIRKSGFKKLQHKMTFDNFKPENDHQKKALGLLKAYVYGEDDPRNLFIYGPAGIGKTHLVVSLAKKFVEQTVKEMKFTTGVNLLNEIRSTFDSRDSSGDVIDQYSEVPLLVIDDLGAEKSTEWAREVLYGIIDNRYSRMLPTFVTSNLSPSELCCKKFDDRLVSRLLNNALVLKLDGKDQRLKACGHP